MQIHQAIEIIFTILLILFLIVMVIAIMTFISVLESLNDFDISFGMRVFFIAGMAGIYLYLLKVMVSKFQDWHRYL